MISKLQLKKLTEHPGKPGSFVLSIYLDVNQSDATNLNREFEVKLKNLLRSAEEKINAQSEIKDFREDARQVQEFVSEYRPQGRTLVLFSDQSEGFFQHVDLNVSLENGAYWTEKPFVRPLAEAIDEYERYGVILIDRAQARLFTVFLGQIEEHREAFAEADVHQFDATGKDNTRSQMQMQRKQDIHALWHLKSVTRMSDKLAEGYSYDRLVLAGTPEATAELQRLLPERLSRRLVGTVPLSIDATEQQILGKILKIQAEVERQNEEELVQDLITAAAKNGQAVTGLKEVLTSLQEGKIRQLVYADDFTSSGAHCPKCEVLMTDGNDRCPYCGSAVQPVDDLVEHVVVKVLDLGGDAEQVRDRAAEQLREAGGVGAFLRF
ncbi:MAG: hypothetical protein ACRD1R_01390 [Acidobacteriota bacterium]